MSLARLAAEAAFAAPEATLPLPRGPVAPPAPAPAPTLGAATRTPQVFRLESPKRDDSKPEAEPPAAAPAGHTDRPPAAAPARRSLPSRRRAEHRPSPGQVVYIAPAAPARAPRPAEPNRPSPPTPDMLDAVRGASILAGLDAALGASTLASHRVVVRQLALLKARLADEALARFELPPRLR